MRAAVDVLPTISTRSAAVTLAATLLALGGCSSPPATTAALGDDPQAANTRPARSGDPDPAPPTMRINDPKTAATLEPAERADSLRDLAERDVEALRELRAGATAETEPTAQEEPAAVAAVIWNDSGTVPPGPSGDDAAAAVLPRANDTIDIAPPPDLAATRVTADAAGRDPLALDQIDVRLVQLRQDLYRRSIDSEQPIRELLAIASMALIDPELELPSGIDRDLNAEEMELLEALHEFYVTLGRDLNAQSPAPETIVNAIRTLETTAIDQPHLTLPAAELCWRIGGFGDFDAFDRAVFLAHAEQQMILYLEIDDFASEQNQNGEWVTEVSQQLEIYSDRDGIPVWSEPWQKAVDRVHKPRRDFFTTQLVTLPKALSVGKYHLKIRVRDENSGAEAEASVPFEMVADPKLAAQVGG